MDNNEGKNPNRKEINLWVLVLILVVLLAVIILAIIGLNKLFVKDENKVNEVANTAEQLQASENQENNQAQVIDSNDEVQANETNNANEETETSATENEELQLTKYEISDENLITILAGFDNFEDGKKLSTEKYLQIAYLALNEDLVKIPGKNNKASVVKYTEVEVKSVIYSLFGIKLAENLSLGETFTYEDSGTYTLNHSDRGQDMPIIKNVGDGAAAGTKILMYDVYKNNDGTEELEGSYMIGISGDEGFVASKKKAE